jgi:hypothetical protein
MENRCGEISSQRNDQFRWDESWRALHHLLASNVILTTESQTLVKKPSVPTSLLFIAKFDRNFTALINTTRFIALHHHLKCAYSFFRVQP